MQGNRVHDEEDSRNLHAPGNSDEVVGHYWHWITFAVRDIKHGLLMRLDSSWTRVDFIFFLSFFLESRINFPACLSALPPACQMSHISSINVFCPMSQCNYHLQSFVISWLCAALLNILFIKGINNYHTPKLLRPERHWGLICPLNLLSLYSIISYPEIRLNQTLRGISLRRNETFYITFNISVNWGNEKTTSSLYLCFN